MDSNVQNNNVGCNTKPDLLLDVLRDIPTNWQEDGKNFTGVLCREVPVHGCERKDVLAALPEGLREKASVYRIHNPFMWTRYVLRKEQLLARDVKVKEGRRYHPIFEVDKRTVKKYNLDWRRYCDSSFGSLVTEKKKPILYNDPSEAMNQLYNYCARNKINVAPREVVLVVVNVLETPSDNLPKLTKARDTEYYPEYFIGLN